MNIYETGYLKKELLENIIRIVEHEDKPNDGSEKTFTEQEMITYMKARLNEREMKVLSARFGFFDEPPKTLEETAKYFGITKERTRQIESKAFRKLMSRDGKISCKFGKL